MKKNTIVKLGATTLTLIMAAGMGISSLAGCGQSGMSKSAGADYAVEEAAEADYSADAFTEDYDSSYEGEEANNSALNGGLSSGSTADVSDESQITDTDKNSQKLIVTWDLNLQSEHYDDTLAEIEKSINSYGGYVENLSESSYSELRYAYFTVRIPADKADAWIENLGVNGTVVSKSKNVENVTLTYVDTESRLKALRTEQESLLALMEKAENVEDIITIQSELTNVNYQIENYESTLRGLDNKVDYTTINVSIDEVKREVPVETTVFEEIREKFFASVDGIKQVARNITVGIFGNILVIAIWAVIIAVAIKVSPKVVKKIISKKTNTKNDIIEKKDTEENKVAKERKSTEDEK